MYAGKSEYTRKKTLLVEASKPKVQGPEGQRANDDAVRMGNALTIRILRYILQWHSDTWLVSNKKPAIDPYFSLHKMTVVCFFFYFVQNADY